MNFRIRFDGWSIGRSNIGRLSVFYVPVAILHFQNPGFIPDYPMTFFIARWDSSDVS
jgi:hypothetical protein